jgi:nucleoside-diphosphate-sugar epimerase
MKKKYLVCGAGGFIGGHLVKSLLNDGHQVVCADVKPLENWYQIFDKNKNFSLDLKEYENCLEVSKEVDFIYNMACNMGGMGFIENNKTECMLSVLINTNLLRACLVNKVKKYFFSSSACVYNSAKQTSVFIEGLKETDAYPAMPEDGYGWEKLFSERMCRHFYEDYGLETRVARYHIEEIAGYKVEKNYQLDKPKGVRGRSSNNDLIREKLGWDFETSLKSGLEITYQWLEKEIAKKLNNNKFSIKY